MLKDCLGVEILLTDHVMVTSWGAGTRLSDTGTKSAVVSLHRTRATINISACEQRAISTGDLSVLRRDGRPGFEGNR